MHLQDWNQGVLLTPCPTSFAFIKPTTPSNPAPPSDKILITAWVTKWFSATSKAIIVNLFQFLKWYCNFLVIGLRRPIKVHQVVTVLCSVYTTREICNSIYEEGNSVHRMATGPKRISLCIYTTLATTTTKFNSVQLNLAAEMSALPLGRWHCSSFFMATPDRVPL